jgi:streptomycin 6-kinase
MPNLGYAIAMKSHQLAARADELIAKWQLVPEGPVLETPSSLLLPVSHLGEEAMLKVTDIAEEQVGMNLLRWWNGEGAVRVLEFEHDAIVMERVPQFPSLAQMAMNGEDEDATLQLCALLNRLHARGDFPHTAGLVHLEDWFSSLLRPSVLLDPFQMRGQNVATALLSDQTEIRVLHGDMHHENAWLHPQRGWLAIDPKGLIGDRTFDFVNLLRNPLGDLPLSPARFAQQVTWICQFADIDRSRLLHWTIAFSSLSAAWIMEDGDDPRLDRAIYSLADELLS